MATNHPLALPYGSFNYMILSHFKLAHTWELKFVDIFHIRDLN